MTLTCVNIKWTSEACILCVRHETTSGHVLKVRYSPTVTKVTLTDVHLINIHAASCLIGYWHSLPSIWLAITWAINFTTIGVFLTSCLRMYVCVGVCAFNRKCLLLNYMLPDIHRDGKSLYVCVLCQVFVRLSEANCWFLSLFVSNASVVTTLPGS